MKSGVITYKDIGVFNTVLSCNFAVGAVFGILSTKTFSFYEQAFIISMSATVGAFDNATGQQVNGFGASVSIFGTEENSPFLVRSPFNTPPTIYIRGVLTDFDVMRYVPANVNVSLLGNGFLESPAAAIIEMNVPVSVYYLISN